MMALIVLAVIALLVWYFWATIVAVLTELAIIALGALFLFCIGWLIKKVFGFIIEAYRENQAYKKWEAEAPLREAEEKRQREAKREEERRRQEAYERECEKERERYVRKEAKRERIRNIVDTRIIPELRNRNSTAFTLLKENGYLDSSKDWRADICNTKSPIYRLFSSYGYFRGIEDGKKM